MILESRIRASAPGLRNLWNRSSVGEAGEDLVCLRAIRERKRERGGEGREPKMRVEGKGFWGDLCREGRVHSCLDQVYEFTLSYLLVGSAFVLEKLEPIFQCVSFYAYSRRGPGH